jgi:hypothetical protein
VGEAEYKRSVTINYLSLWQNVGCRSARLERVANDRPISDVMARVHPSHWKLNDSVNRFDTSHVTLQWQPHPQQRHTKFLNMHLPPSAAIRTPPLPPNQSTPLRPGSECFFFYLFILFGAPHFAIALQIFSLPIFEVSSVVQPQACNFQILAFGQTFRNPAVVRVRS